MVLRVMSKGRQSPADPPLHAGLTLQYNLQCLGFPKVGKDFPVGSVQNVFAYLLMNFSTSR